MRTVSDDVSVRLYHLDEGGGTTTLLYGTLAAALALAATQAEAIRRASDILAAEDGGTLTVRGTDSKMTSSARVEGDGTRTVSKGDE